MQFNLLLKKSLTLTGGLFLLSTVFIMGMPDETPLLANTQSLEFTISPSNFSSLATNLNSDLGNEYTGTISVSGVDVGLGAKKTLASGTELHLAKDQGVIYNTTPLPGSVTRIDITQNTGQSTSLYLGSANRLVTSTTAHYTVNGTAYSTTSSTTQLYTITNASTLDYSYFALKGTGGTTNQITLLKFTVSVSTIVVSNASTFNFAVDFFIGTNNKAGLCDAVNLNWSSWETQYNALSTSDKTTFNTDTTDTDILAARSRYLYLRTANPTLTNFANL